MADDKVLEWQDAQSNGIEVVLLDDDFSNSIDGSGYVQVLDTSLTPTQAQEQITKLIRETEFL